MSSHVTLRGLMGLGDGPAALQDSALIMIDCQNTYRRGVMQLDGAEDAFAEAARMLARARASVALAGPRAPSSSISVPSYPTFCTAVSAAGQSIVPSNGTR